MPTAVGQPIQVYFLNYWISRVGMYIKLCTYSATGSAKYGCVSLSDHSCMPYIPQHVGTFTVDLIIATCRNDLVKSVRTCW